MVVLAREVCERSNVEFEQSPGLVTDWHREHVLAPTKLEEFLIGFKIKLLRIISFFKPAPLVAGIDPDLQERSYFRLLWAKLRNGEDDFTTLKRLVLSQNRSFLLNQGWAVSRPFPEIDNLMIPLSYKVNGLPNFFISDSCSGHVYENPDHSDECIIKPHGYVTIHCSSKEKADVLAERLRNLCLRVNDKQNVFKFNFYRLRYGFEHFDVQWRWQESSANAYYQLRCSKSSDGSILRKMYSISKDFRDRDCMKIVRDFLNDLQAIFEYDLAS